MTKKKIESKKKIDAGVQSKTARASMAKGKGKPEGFIASGEMDRLIPLDGGNHCYLLDPCDGRTHHLRTGSAKYETVINSIFETTHGNRLRGELIEKGFPVPQNLELVPNA